MGKRVYVKKDVFLEWLLRVAVENQIERPILAAVEAGFLRETAERWLKFFVKEGLLKLEVGHCDGKKEILIVRVLGGNKKYSHGKGQVIRRLFVEKVGVAIAPADVVISKLNKGHESAIEIKADQASSKNQLISIASPPVFPLSSRDGVIVLFDYDNVACGVLHKNGNELDIPSMYDAVVRYAGSLGVVLKKEAYITTSTVDRDFVVKMFFSLDKTPVIIVPPQKDAADIKMIESVEFSLMMPRMKAIVIVSDDNKAFGPLCERIRRFGCEAHIITTGFISPALAREATHIRGLADLISKVVAANEKKCFSREARSIAGGIENLVTDKERFVAYCLEAIRKMTDQPGSWFSFFRLYEYAWLRMSEVCKSGFTLEDCRCAMDALIAVGAIKKGIFFMKNKDGSTRETVGYFSR